MESLNPTTLAGFKILVAIAKADGNISTEEMGVLTEALQEHGELLNVLLTSEINVDEAIAELKTPEAKERVYRAAFALAYADDHMAHDEVKLLEKIWPEHEEESVLEEVVGELKDTLLPDAIRPIADPAKRATEIDHDTLKYAIIAGAVGAIPVPVVSILADAAVIGIQMKLVRDIGQYWGHTVDKEAARSLLTAAAGGTGMRIAVNSLVRFIPGWGGAFAAGTSFASTFAIGKVANAYFEGDRALSEADMKDLFKKAKASGKSTFSQEKTKVDAAKKAHEAKIEAMSKDVAQGKMSAEEYKESLISII